MELLDESLVPESVRSAKREARAFARDHIEPNAEKHFDDGTYPTSVVDAASDADLVGEEGAGFRMVAEFFDHGRVSASGHGIGIAAAALEEAWDFVERREEFGCPIGEFQSVQHDLADARTEFESARTLTWRAAERAESTDAATNWAAMAKTKATETAVECTETGMRLHGGCGILNERRISRLYRDARLPVIYEGVNEIQRDLIYRHT